MDKFAARRQFRKKHRGLILTVRCLLLVGVPLAYVTFAGLEQNSGLDLKISDAHNRHLLIAEPEVLDNCTPAAILDFPWDGFTKEERQSGWIAIHVVASCYAFILLAIVCDDYFVPSIEQICSKLHMTEDVAGATFMAIASSSPELFINTVGTFVTEGDIGVGTIVGSAVFNILAVPACCGLIAGQVIDLDWWAVSRDSLMYGISVIALIFTLQDEKVMWYEASILVLAYTLYILAMYFNQSISGCVRNICTPKSNRTYTEITPLLHGEKGQRYSSKGDLVEEGAIADDISVDNDLKHEDSEDETNDVWKWPEDSMCIGKLYFVFTWPIRFILWVTIPNCKKYKRLFFITFFMCILWIGFTSYFCAWQITVIGDTINIPDSVMGLTFLAAGTSVPEAVSSVIVTNQGHGSMGISSSIGSNTFDILLCLGLPWFIKSYFYPSVPGEYWVNINSSGLMYSALSLLSTLIGLYGSFACNKFRLDWKIGLACTFMYIAFLTVASLIELNFFFPVNLPTCNH